jgi:hypothetical protein
MSLVQYVNGPPFLTALDPENQIKGSRDPLGVERIWTNLGRTLVGNLTTVTRSVRQFTTLLLGIHFASQVSPQGDEEDGFLSAFLRFEQLAAYSRYLHLQAHRDIRGVRAVRRNLNEGGGTVPISVLPKGQILSSQQAYGIYGLFRMASRASGLLEDALEDLLTRTGRAPTVADVVERQVASLPKNCQHEILSLIARNGKVDVQSDVLKALSHALRPNLTLEEVGFYGAYLVRGEHLVDSHLQSVQARLWEVLEAVSTARPDQFGWDREFSMLELMACIERARRAGDSDLADRLNRVQRCEELLGLSARLFDYLIGQDGQALTAVTATIKQAWLSPPSWLEVSDLTDAFAVGGAEVPDRMLLLTGHLRSGDYQQVCRLLLEQNKAVMKERGGGPWIVLEKDVLKVRYREQAGQLPAADKLRSLWEHTYFLNSLKSIGGQVYYGQVGGESDGEE